MDNNPSQVSQLLIAQRAISNYKLKLLHLGNSRLHHSHKVIPVRTTKLHLSLLNLQEISSQIYLRPDQVQDLSSRK